MRLWKIQTLVVSTVVALGFVAYGAYTAWEQTARERQEITHDARNLAKIIAAASADDILARNYDRIEAHLLRQASLSSIRELVISDSEGRVLSSVKRLADGGVEPVYGQIFIDKSQLADESVQDGQYTLYVPIERGAHLGDVKVVASFERLDEVREHIWRDTLGVTLMTVLCLVGIQGLLLRRMGRNLEATADFANELIHQRGKTIVQDSRITELRQLRTALNRVSLDLSRQHRSLSESESRKSAILEAWMDCLIIIDEHGQVIEFNKAAEETFGYAREAAVGQEMADLIVPAHLRAAHHAGMKHYLATGEGPALGKRLEMPALHSDGSEFPVELTIVPFSAHGQRFFLGALRDLRAQKKLEEERKLVEDRLLSTLADLDARDRALDDHAIVSVTDLQGTILYANRKFSEVSGYANDELVGQNHRILKSGIHGADFYEDMWSTISGGKTWHGEIANRRKNGSMYWVMSTIVPVLGADGLPRQYIAIRTDITEQKLTAEKLAKARARELAFGFQIQQSLLFGKIPEQVADVSLAVHNEPSAGIDGDFYEFTEIGDGLFDLAVGDVMGKGIPAALIGAGVKQALGRVTQSLHFAPMDPEQLVNELHGQVFESLLEFSSFVTFVYIRFDQGRSRISFVDAGHTKAILANAGDTRFLEGDNLPLGVSADEVYRQASADWLPGDTLLLYSDGVTEALNARGEMYGAERLSTLVRDLNREQVPAVVINQAVRAEVDAFLGERTPNDDITCIVADYPAGPAPLAALQLDWNADALTVLRAEASRAASTRGLSAESLQALILAVSETGANIVRHAPERLHGSKIHVAVRADRANLDVDFHYIGERFEHPEADPDFSGQTDSGFGLYIVRHSVDEVSYDELPHKVFRIRLRKHLALDMPPEQT